jgi:hypothetical protein
VVIELTQPGGGGSAVEDFDAARFGDLDEVTAQRL